MVRLTQTRNTKTGRVVLEFSLSVTRIQSSLITDCFGKLAHTRNVKGRETSPSAAVVFMSSEERLKMQTLVILVPLFNSFPRVLDIVQDIHVNHETAKRRPKLSLPILEKDVTNI